MPIPFPIPMPMPQKPPMPANNHYGSNHENGHGHEEVKKIYILQPMGRVPHSPKGGGGGGASYGGGSVQHMPSAVNYNTKSVPRPSFEDTQQSVDESPQQADNYSPKQHSSGHKGTGGGFHTDEQLKILPIVVIPPIAPMTPIQLSPPQSQHSNPHGSAGGRKRPFHSSNFNDQKSFADYGGSGGGSAFRIRSVGGGDIAGGSSDLDNLLDDYDSGSGSGSSWRSTHSNANRRFGNGNNNNRRFSRQNGNQRRHLAPIRLNSIRDILEQATVFDDEPTSGGSGIVSAATSNGRGQHCCSGSNSNINTQRFRSLMSPPMGADSNDRDSLDYDYRLPSGSSSSARILHRNYNNNHNYLPEINNQPESQEQMLLDTIRNEQNKNNYFNDDSIGARNSMLSRSRSRFANNNYNYHKNVQFDDQDMSMEQQDDQWRYDSIKSVVHEQPDSINDTKVSKSTATTQLDGANDKNNTFIDHNNTSEKLHKPTTTTTTELDKPKMLGVNNSSIELINNRELQIESMSLNPK